MAFQAVPERGGLRAAGLGSLEARDEAGIIGLLLYMLPNIRYLDVKECSTTPKNFVHQSLEDIAANGAGTHPLSLCEVDLIGTNVAGPGDSLRCLSLIFNMPTLIRLRLFHVDFNENEEDICGDDFPRVRRDRSVQMRPSNVATLVLVYCSVDPQRLSHLLSQFRNLKAFGYTSHSGPGANAVTALELRDALLASSRETLELLALYYTNMTKAGVIGTLSHFKLLVSLSIQISVLADSSSIPFDNLAGRLPPSLEKIKLIDDQDESTVRHDTILRELCSGKETADMPKLAQIRIIPSLRTTQSNEHQHRAKQWARLCEKHGITLKYNWIPPFRSMPSRS